MAPAEERATGLPQDSICMTVAARLTSTLFWAAQRSRLAAQNWISGVKSVESALSPAGRGAGCKVVSRMAALPALAGGLANAATNRASRALANRAASGGSKKPDRQPLLSVV